MEQFAEYLVKEKRASANTAKAYVRDVLHFGEFLKDRGVKDICDGTNGDVVSYLMDLKQAGRSKSTINRKLASIRTYYHFLQRESKIKENPADNIRSPKIEKKEMEFLQPEQINALMELPDETDKGIRDRAILELLYATGVRASELIDMKLEDINLRMGFITCSGENIRARIIPIGRMARAALEKYFECSRKRFVRNNEAETHLFVNFQGKPITRQGLWKILKEYGVRAGLDLNLTPQVIRNSFAIHMLQNGADIKSLQELMGHEDISATQAYLAYVKTRIKDVYDRAHPRA